MRDRLVFAAAADATTLDPHNTTDTESDQVIMMVYEPLLAFDDTMKIVPKLEGSDIPFDVDDAVIILCDEVLFTGRTSRAALEELLDYGRPRCVQFAVLVDRHGRELPLQADYAGTIVRAGELTLEQRVSVRFKESDGWNEVFIRQLPSTSS